MGLQQVSGVQTSGKFFIAKERVNLFMTGRTNADGRAKVLAMALVSTFGVLLWREVMFGEFWAGAIAQFTHSFFSVFGVGHVLVVQTGGNVA